MAEIGLRQFVGPLQSNKVSEMAQRVGLQWPPPPPISVRDLIERAGTAVVLSGGGAKGSFEVGALKYLYGIGVRPRIICSTSVGSINGLKLAEGEGDQSQGFQGLEKLWLDMKYDSDMYVEDSWFKNTPSWIKDAISGVKGAGQPDYLFLFLLGIVPYLATFSTVELQQLGDFFDTAKKAHGIYNLQPIQELAKRNINVDLLGNIRLRMAVVGLSSGAVRYVTERGRLLEDPTAPSDDLHSPEVDIIRGMLASAAIPVVFEMQQLSLDWYVDGGLREIVPVKAAIAMGATKVYALVAPIPLAKDEDYTNKGLIDIGTRAATDITIDQITTDNIAPCGGWPIPVIIRPTVEVESSRDIDPGLIRMNISYGWMRAYDVLSAAEIPNVQDSSDNIAKLRLDIWKSENTLYNDVLQVNWVAGSPGGPADPGWYARVRADIDALREKKGQLVPLLQSRVDIAGSSSMLGDAASWIYSWEAHQWDPNTNLIDPRAGQFLFPSSPWGQFFFEIEGQTILVVPADFPPKWP